MARAMACTTAPPPHRRQISPFYSVPPTVPIRYQQRLSSASASAECRQLRQCLSYCHYVIASMPLPLSASVPFLPLSHRSAIFLPPPHRTPTTCCGRTYMMRVPSDPIRHTIWKQHNAHSKHKAHSVPLSFLPLYPSRIAMLVLVNTNRPSRDLLFY